PERDSGRKGGEGREGAGPLQEHRRQTDRRFRQHRRSDHPAHEKNPRRSGEVRAVRWLRFAIGLLIALTLHSLLDSFYPNALAFFNPYLILVVYYAMGGNLVGAIFAGIAAGLVQDAYSGAICGLHAFSLTVIAYIVAYINARLVLRGTLPFGACLFGGAIVNDLVIFVMV